MITGMMVEIVKIATKCFEVYLQFIEFKNELKGGKLHLKPTEYLSRKVAKMIKKDESNVNIKTRCNKGPHTL